MKCCSSRKPHSMRASTLILDQKKPAITVGLTYDRITGRRKPLVRTRGEATQIFNIITQV